MSSTASFTAFVAWPSAPLTDRLVRNALASLPRPPVVVDGPGSGDLLQWSTYDLLNHDLTYSAASSAQSPKVLASSYVIRKALIRKHYLSRCVHNYLVKNPESVLRRAIPKTWDLELSFADEVDEMWGDELWDLGQELDEENKKWWILKPGMADRGMGIRLLHSKDDLEQIFREFEENEDEDELQDDEDGNSRDTSVVTSQLRHFVIQEYLLNPLLLDPTEVPLPGSESSSAVGDIRRGHKFHLRAYCVASGALTVYLYERILALFSAIPYSSPNDQADDSNGIDLAAHLTNTSLQTDRGEAGVRLLDELIGCHLLSNLADNTSEGTFTAEDVQDIKSQMSECLAETFKAALNMSVHFQTLPNAFELYGVDFMITHWQEPPNSSRFQVHLLEVNSEPAIELTGPRLTWILQDLFSSIARTCVVPFFKDLAVEDKTSDTTWPVGEIRHHLRKCLSTKVRGSW